MKALGLKIQITVLVILLIAGIVAIFSWTVATNERQMMLGELQRRVLMQARNIASSSSKALLREDPEFFLHPLISRMIKTDPNITSIAVVDNVGIVRGHNDVVWTDREYRETPGMKRIVYVDFLSRGEVLKENEDIFEVNVPITDQQETVGTIRLGYSKSEVQLAVDQINTRMMRIGIIAIAVGALVSLLLAFHVSSPISVLTRSVEAIGRGQLDTRINVQSVREIDTLAATFNEMARRLEEDQKAIVEKERMEKELEIAHGIQATLLPSKLPHLTNFEMDVYYHPASQVGGDYFDLIPLGDNRLFVVVGDVAGKGVPGLVIMAMVRVIVRALVLQGERPSDLLRHLNILLKRDMKKNIFVTLFCGLLDSDQGSLEFASAAHMPLLVYHGRDRMVQMVGTKTKPLGLFPDEEFSKDLEEKKVRLMPGDLFMQYTDGLSEMKNVVAEEFGIERVMQLAVDEAAGGARHFIKELKKHLSKFRGDEAQSDDLTLLAISALPEGMERAPTEKMDLLDTVVFD